jgi:predicted CoA-binding protein
VNHDNYDDKFIIDVLKDSKLVAMVGASASWNRPSFFAMKYMQQKGFRVIPVNPGVAGKTILGEVAVASLDEVEEPIDMVDIFRNSKAADQITDDAIKVGAKIVWMQLGVRNDEAAKRAEDAGLRVVMNRCPKIEYARLNGELSWHGINSHVITSKRRKQS